MRCFEFLKLPFKMPFRFEKFLVVFQNRIIQSIRLLIKQLIILHTVAHTYYISYPFRTLYYISYSKILSLGNIDASQML